MKKLQDTQRLNDYLALEAIQTFFSKDLLHLFELFSFDSGEFIINEGFCSNYLFLITDGKAKVFTLSTSGTMMLLGFCEPFQLIGESASLWGKEAIASVQAISQVTCIGISLTHYRHLLLNDITFLRHTCGMLSQKLYICNSVFGNIFLNPIENRLAFYILHTSPNGIFCNSLTESAEILSTSYRHLLRVFNTFCANGILEKKGKHYIIKDYDALKKMTHPRDES